MRVALLNPRWSFGGSIYFGCREPHLPLELGYAKALLERAGHRVLMLDGHLLDLSHFSMADHVAAFHPDLTVVATAPTYLFWRCAQPELRAPRDLLDAIGSRGGMRAAVGPHGSATPLAALRKLDVDVVVRGECEEALLELADHGRPETVSGLAYRTSEGGAVSGSPRAAGFVEAPPLRWSADWIARHRHHHHRFETAPEGPGAEVEASRGCPFACTFCAKLDYRDRYRRRARGHVLDEIDGLITQGVRYVYFIDEIFLPDEELLEALASRNIAFGIQTRIDLWKPWQIDLLGRAGCVSVEAGVESLTERGRSELAKKCRLTTAELTELLIRARSVVPFVQANLIATAHDRAEELAEWRERLRAAGVWANDPVPLFPYPSSPEFRRLFGAPADDAWEQAHGHYLAQFRSFSDIQDERPEALSRLEAACT